jgi:hypothetical protein
MNVPLAEALILQTGVKIALQHRFAFDTGTILRLENDAIINIFDDGRYYLQGENTQELAALFGRVEAPWDPDSWDGEVPTQTPGKAGTQLPPGGKGQAGGTGERLDF